MTLSANEVEYIEENQEELGLTDEEVQTVKQKRALYNPLGNPKGEACPACDDPECIKALAIVDEGDNIHAEDHPEMRNARASENQRGW